MTEITYVNSEDEINHLVNLLVQGSLNKFEGEKVIVEIRALASQKNVVFCVISQMQPLI